MPAPRKNTESELEALRQEVADLKAEREKLSQPAETQHRESAEAPPELDEEDRHWSKNLETIVKDLEPHADSAVEAIEEVARKHPLPVLAATLLGGIILGSLLSRK